MEHSKVEDIVAKQQLKYDATMASNTRGTSALALLKMALEHRSDSAHAAAKLLLAMENGRSFDFILLLRLDSVHRAHADTLMLGYQPHHIWPSKWIEDENTGIDAAALLLDLADKWDVPESTTPSLKERACKGRVDQTTNRRLKSCL